MKGTIVGLCALAVVTGAFGFRFQLAQNALTPVKIQSDLVRGAYHIHTDASHDGKQTRAQVIAAAQALNLDFIIVTDHNLEQWETKQEDSLWVVRGPEMSTDDGHTVRLQADEGFFDIVAHPGRPRRPRREPLTTEVGLELTNPTVALEELAYQRPFALWGALIASLAEPHTGLLALLNHDKRSLELLGFNGQRSLWCGVDAHGWIPARQNLAVWITSLGLKRSELNEESLLNALKSGPAGCYSMLLSDNQPIEVIEEDSGAWRFQIRKKLAYPGSFRLYRDGALIATSAAARFDYRPKLEGQYHIEYWVSPKGLPFIDFPRLAAFRNLSSNATKE